MQRRTEPEQRARNLSEWFPYLPLPKLPAIFGLDSAGVGAAVGSHVTDVAVGDRVYVNPGISCGGCNACRQGHDQQQQVTIDYINRYKSEYGVEPICRMLSEHGCSIAPFTYYEARNRPASRRSVRDEELEAEVSRVHAEHSSVYGARKVWLEMRRQGIEVARCTVERLMGVLELQGARRGKTKRTTIADAQGRRADDLVQRKFNPVAPNMLWVADLLTFRHGQVGCTSRSSSTHIHGGSSGGEPRRR